MDLIVFLAILSGLFLAIALSEPLAARLRLPVTVILAAIGIGIGAAASWFFRTNVTDALNPLALAILNLAQLPDSDRAAIAAYLKTLPAAEEQSAEPG